MIPYSHLGKRKLKEIKGEIDSLIHVINILQIAKYIKFQQWEPNAEKYASQINLKENI